MNEKPHAQINIETYNNPLIHRTTIAIFGEPEAIIELLTKLDIKVKSK